MTASKTQVNPPARDGALSWAEDAPIADRECGRPRAMHGVRCNSCGRTVIIHCDSCRIQVSGCTDTLILRMGPVDAYRQLAEQVGQKKAQREFKRLGYNMPYLVGIPD